jgi:hypothetical protein
MHALSACAPTASRQCSPDEQHATSPAGRPPRHGRLRAEWHGKGPSVRRQSVPRSLPAPVHARCTVAGVCRTMDFVRGSSSTVVELCCNLSYYVAACRNMSFGMHTGIDRGSIDSFQSAWDAPSASFK